jgi:hypothetical protein
VVDKYWIKFNSLYVDCMCPFEDKKCRLEEDHPECKLYVAKFIEIIDENKRDESVKSLKDTSKRLEDTISKKLKKRTSELEKSLKKFKI